MILCISWFFISDVCRDHTSKLVSLRWLKILGRHMDWPFLKTQRNVMEKTRNILQIKTYDRSRQKEWTSLLPHLNAFSSSFCRIFWIRINNFAIWRNCCRHHITSLSNLQRIWRNNQSWNQLDVQHGIFQFQFFQKIQRKTSFHE